MTEWKPYTGSHEQIEEINNAKDVLFKYKEGRTTLRGNRKLDTYDNDYLSEFLICNPHPLADMICQQARTGQPVWIKFSYEYVGTLYHYMQIYGDKLTRISEDFVIVITTKPNWNIPGAQYRFTPFVD